MILSQVFSSEFAKAFIELDCFRRYDLCSEKTIKWQNKIQRISGNVDCFALRKAWVIKNVLMFAEKAKERSRTVNYFYSELKKIGTYITLFRTAVWIFNMAALHMCM